MFKTAKQKIENTKIQQDPFPFLFVRNLISNKDLKRLNKVLPNYDAIVNDEILYQSKSKSKKLFYQNQRIKKLNNCKEFRNINLIFKKLKTNNS